MDIGLLESKILKLIEFPEKLDSFSVWIENKRWFVDYAYCGVRLDPVFGPLYDNNITEKRLASIIVEKLIIEIK